MKWKWDKATKEKKLEGKSRVRGLRSEEKEGIMVYEKREAGGGRGVMEEG